MSYEFYADAMKRSAKRNMDWYQKYLLKVLQDAKEKRVREIDVSIALADKLKKLLEEPLPPPTEVPLRHVTQSEDDSLMKPIEQHVQDLLWKSTEKGGDRRYLHERNKKSPEDKFFFRIVTSWDYGWQQKQSRLLGREVNAGRCAILRDTFYRKNNLTPDSPHTAMPAGGETSICSQYQCNPN